MRQEAEAAANRMKSDFLASVSHELRRPLDAIIGYTELIGEELQGSDAERTRADLDRVTESARRLLVLIGEVLDVSRIDAGRLELRPETFDVAELVRALGESAARSGPARLETLGDLGVAHTDRRRLNQCLANALLNARCLSPEGLVVLRASRSNDVMRFEVQAAGASLTPEQLAHALDPLSGAHRASSRLAGSGLALVVTRKLLSILGGAFEVRSNAEGATFVLNAAAVLPAAPRQAASRAAAC
jgi:signal transduction histidine kinase